MLNTVKILQLMMVNIDHIKMYMSFWFVNLLLLPHLLNTFKHFAMCMYCAPSYSTM